MYRQRAKDQQVYSDKVQHKERNRTSAGVQGINEHAASRYKVYVRVDVWSRGQAYRWLYWNNIKKGR